MPPRARVTVEEFDDDTDLPLPSHAALPNTGTRGALLEQIGVDDGHGHDSDSDDDDAPPLVPASRAPGNMGMGAGTGVSAAAGGARPNVINVTDTTPYKKWTTVYPIYIDAKRPYGPTQRRLARSKAVWWPLSQDLSDAARKLGLQCLHESTKFHPRDWENPGRIKVLLKKDGRAVHPSIKTKRQLVERLAAVVQMAHPEWVPKGVDAEEKAGGPSSSSAQKGKAKGRRHAGPPEPWPPLAQRVSPYSPALEAGMLVEAVKASLQAPQATDAHGNPVPVPGGVGKGKKKVIRVRG
ncbi:signal recognition particle, SRP19 subunit [Auricularia subglabra TFB-10046 SS5]|nr:signal recognition particle, SRP19 subunit [Auricularia subglabra TFB-10046 SS5]